jgi:hypothetical protein
MFGAMNSGASPTIYAFSGVVIVISVAVVALVFAGLAGSRAKATTSVSQGRPI